MGRKAKEHRKKVAKRNDAIKQQQKVINKARQAFLEELIKKEKEKGAFDNNKVIASTTPGISAPTLTSEGPQI